MKPFSLCLSLLLLFSIIIAQLFWPVPSGLANNGDFGKVIGRENFVSVDNNGSDNFIYFVNEYYYEPKFHYDSEMMTSEYAIFLVSAWAAHHFFGGTLELRQHGLLHLGLLSVGLILAGLAICRLGALRFALAAIIGVCVFSDIAYTAYLNSFYMDAAALVGIVICLGAGLCLGLRDLPALTMGPLFCLGVLLVVTSKTQHSMLALPALALYAALIWSDNRRSVRITALMLSLIVFGTAVAQMRSTKHDYAAKAAYNVIFHKILPVSATPAADLEWFGLPREYQKMSGMHAFLPNSPCNDPAWLDAFASKVRPKDIGLFWLQHPLRFLDAAWRDLIVSIHEVRPVNLANVRRASGLPPGTKLPSVFGWSNLKAYLLAAIPSLYLWLVVLSVLFALWIVRIRGGAGVKLASALLALSIAGAGEFVMAVCFDSIETSRHFIVMHLLMDILLATLIFGLLAGVTAVSSRRG